MNRTTGYTWEPLQVSFRVKIGDPPTPLVLKCVVTYTTNYHILVIELSNGEYVCVTFMS